MVSFAFPAFFSAILNAAEGGLRRLLQFLGESLECERVYVFEDMDRQHIRNTYEWCREGVPSGIEQLPYVAKKDLSFWYARLADGNGLDFCRKLRGRADIPVIFLTKPYQLEELREAVADAVEGKAGQENFHIG